MHSIPLSLLGLTNGERNVANYMRAAAEAEAVLRIDPRHPGALHYLIHATDDPVHAPLGLQAARLYGKVATAASHAQHMPSHIFFALGLWGDAIEANLASLKNGRAYGKPTYHSLLWLAYAYLQNSQPALAEQLVRSVATDVAASPSKDNRARLAYARAMWLVETRGMQRPDANAPVDNRGINSINYFVVHDFAQGIGAASHRLAEAKAALVQLQERIDMAQVTSNVVTVNWLDNVTSEELQEAKILALALSGTIRFYAGDEPAGIEQVREASTRAEHLQFDYGPPWSVKPLDELLGELLLAAGRLDEAATAFRKTLAGFPNRRLAREDLAGVLAKIAIRGPRNSATAPVLRREDLVGAWHLARIDYEGSNGRLDDPFYHEGSSGLLTYDESGSMSVQIAGLTRPRVSVPDSRPVNAASIVDAQAKAVALDSYYAYFGTWDYDATRATVTHHISSALLPAENGLSYSQQVALVGNQLTFVTHQKTAADDYVRTKIWQRVSAVR